MFVTLVITHLKCQDLISLAWVWSTLGGGGGEDSHMKMIDMLLSHLGVEIAEFGLTKDILYQTVIFFTHEVLVWVECKSCCHAVLGCG